MYFVSYLVSYFDLFFTPVLDSLSKFFLFLYRIGCFWIGAIIIMMFFTTFYGHFLRYLKVGLHFCSMMVLWPFNTSIPWYIYIYIYIDTFIDVQSFTCVSAAFTWHVVMKRAIFVPLFPYFYAYMYTYMHFDYSYILPVLDNISSYEEIFFFIRFLLLRFSSFYLLVVLVSFLKVYVYTVGFFPYIFYPLNMLFSFTFYVCFVFLWHSFYTLNYMYYVWIYVYLCKGVCVLFITSFFDCVRRLPFNDKWLISPIQFWLVLHTHADL